MIDKIYYINLDHRLDRKEHIEKLLTDSFTMLKNQLDAVGMEYKKHTKILAELSSDIEYYRELLYSDSDDESEEDKSSSSEETHKRTPYELKAIYSARIKETEEELEKTFLAIHPEENHAIDTLPAGTVVEIPDEAFYDWTEQGCTLAYFQALQESVDLFLMHQNIGKAMDYIAIIHSKMGLDMGAAIKSIPKSVNSTTVDIAQGLYAELSRVPEHYSKIPGSEKFNYQLSTSDHHPDDNSGSGAIITSPKKDDDTKHSNIE